MAEIPADPVFQHSVALFEDAPNLWSIKDRIDRLVEGTGFTVAELYGFPSRGRGRGKSVAKYATPEDRSETWTGRGRKPNWLVARLKKGAKVDDFSI